jgi:GNAT superfamily N-acetyltransferase
MSSVRIRPAMIADARAIAAVHVGSWQTTYRGIVPDDALDGMSIDRRAEGWTRRLGDPASTDRTFVAARDDGAIVGFATCGPQRDGFPGYDGELFMIYLLAEAQHHGIGRRLMSAAAAALAEIELTHMIVWVAAGNQLGRPFYEALGGQLLPFARSQDFFGTTIAEVAYGWPNCRMLVLPE